MIPVVKPGNGKDLKLWHRLRPDQPTEDEVDQIRRGHHVLAQQLKPRVLLYEFRHGETKANADNRFRGWKNYPLDEHGRKEAEKLAKWFEGKNVFAIVCSDLVRAVETAEIIGKALGVTVHPDPALRPWNVGDLAGEKRDAKNVKIIEDHLAHPEKVMLGGESYRQFQGRCLEALVRYGKLAKNVGRPLAVGFHTSNVMASYDAVEGRDKPSAELEEVISPGGVMGIVLNGGHLSAVPLLGKVEKSEKAIS